MTLDEDLTMNIRDNFYQALFILLLTLILMTPKASLANSALVNIKGFKTTYQKFLVKALAGDPKAQNFIGYMSFFGEATKQDYDQAHYWFHLAAENGEIRAQRNLGLFHARALIRIPEYYFDAKESNLWLSKASSALPDVDLNEHLTKVENNIDYFTSGSPFENGQRIYRGFCAGCHGFNGIATFNLSPSFAQLDRLEKSDEQLLKSIREGKNNMPSWKQILTEEHQKNVLLYIRTGFKLSKVNQPTTIDHNSSDIISLGAKTYAKVCAGCHGFSGIAYYVNSPSFALGERLEKSNATLKKSIENGRNIMPGWGDMLSNEEIAALVIYIRTLAVEFDVGIEREINKPANFYYKFKPRGGWKNK
ncbi:c-type cytochrome [Thalassotalea sp. G2M2-11]|uniref:c-type cytochrome n=1 Tax=Thalassotalea sp. G2M2-11 TaxID=2787627 RepID=UPI0019D2B1D7|nr:c-type cytochrome [Thalassotalea sp. G2M2-11]